MSKAYVFYATLLYGEYTINTMPPYRDLPEGCYLYFPNEPYKKYWYLKGMTPVLEEDIPKELKTLVLLMGI